VHYLQNLNVQKMVIAVALYFVFVKYSKAIHNINVYNV